VADVIRPGLDDAAFDADDAAAMAALLDDFAATTIVPTEHSVRAIVYHPPASIDSAPSPIDIALSRQAVADALAVAVFGLSVQEVLTAAWLRRLFENWLLRRPTGQQVLDAMPN
jgi:hypothetical protein